MISRRKACCSGIGYIHSGGTANAWLVDWTSTDAYPQWEVAVLTAGTYEVTLLYNCREADVHVISVPHLGEGVVTTTITGTNVDATSALAEAAGRAGVKRFVFMSSIKVNGERSPICWGMTSPRPFSFPVRPRRHSW